MADDSFRMSGSGLWLDSDSVVGYDAVKDNQRRRPPKRRVYPQDRRLRNQIRERAIATTQDLQSNYAVVAWAIRKHLDYVSTLTFNSKTGDESLDAQVESFMQWWDRRGNCDVRRRHSFRRMLRMAEMRRVVDGDFGFLKVGGSGRNRGHLQAVEAYRIYQPTMEIDTIEDLDNWWNGVEIDSTGATKRYAVYRVTQNTRQFERFVSAENMAWYGYYERFDQVRGISPILAGLNAFQDVYEAEDLFLAKMKINAIFGLVFYRDGIEGHDQYGGPVPTGDQNGDGIGDTGYEYDFGSGPQLMDLDPGDRAEFLEAKTPAGETTEFMKFVLTMALKSLDLPTSFLYEAETNFFGSRAAQDQYLRTAESKQKDLIEMVDEITAWRLSMAVADGDIRLPAGMSARDLRWEWSPRGARWWNPVQESTGAKSAIAAGLDNFERVAKEYDGNIKDNIDINAKWMNYARDRYGMELQLAESTSDNRTHRTTEETDGNESSTP